MRGNDPRRQGEEAKSFAAQLYARRDEGVIVTPGRVTIDGWQPVERDCHDNVTRVVNADKRYTAVRGWLYFSYNDATAFVCFNAHSVIEVNGTLVDITPQQTLDGPYPFIRDGRTDAEFFAFLERHDLSQLYHQKWGPGL